MIGLNRHVGTMHTSKGEIGGPSGPSREGPDVGHKMASDTKQIIKKRRKKNKRRGKGENMLNLIRKQGPAANDASSRIFGAWKELG